MRLDEYFTEAGQPFLYFPGFVTKYGLTINAAIYLGFIGWRTRPGEDGWRHLSMAETELATGLSQKEQLSARNLLVERGWIEFNYKRLEHKLLVRLTAKELKEPSKSPKDFPKIPEGVSYESPQGIMPKVPKGVSNIGESLLKREDIEKPLRSAPGMVSEGSPHRKFIELWFAAFQEVTGDRYVFSAGKDGAALKRLLQASGLPPESLVAIARQAWQLAEDRQGHFRCGGSLTIRGFASAFNEIRAEVKRPAGVRNGQRPVELRGGNTPDDAPFFTPEMDRQWGGGRP